MKKRNSVIDLVKELKFETLQTENELMQNAFGFIRGRGESNKKYADLLRRALKKNLVCRINNTVFPLRDDIGNATFLYFVPKKQPKPLKPKVGN